MSQRILPLALTLLATSLSACSASGFLRGLIYQGRLESGPRLTNGQQDGTWTYWYDADREHMKAQGRFEKDEHVGTWTWWHANGNKMQEVHLEHDTFEGPMSTYWESGKPRASGTYCAGLKDGAWTFWREDGSRECAGDFARDLRESEWTYWNPDGSELERVAFVHGERQPVPAVAPAAVEPVTPVVPEVVANPTPRPVPSSAPVPEPARPSLVLPRNPLPPPIGLQPLPFTTLQDGEAAADKRVRGAASPGLDLLIQIYDHCKSARSSTASDEYGDARNPASEPVRDDGRSDPLLNKPLSWTRVTREDGSVLDLASYRGKSKVLLVVMRGMKGTVCEYCCGQAEVLKHRVPDFKKAGTEVVIVYPGDEEVLSLFHDRVKEYYSKHYGAENRAECVLACDVGLRLVDALGVRRDLAVPTTVILDTKGVVRFAYVGRDKQDRLCADQLLDAVKAVR